MRVIVYACEADEGLAPLNVSRGAGGLRLCGESVLSRVGRQAIAIDPDAVLISDAVDESASWPGTKIFDVSDHESLRTLAEDGDSSEILVLRGVAYLDDAGLSTFLDSGAPLWSSSEKPGRQAACLGIRLSADQFLSGVVDSRWLEGDADGCTCPLSFALIYPWHLIEANVLVLQSMESSRTDGVIDEGAEVSGPVIVGKGTRIRCGTVIEGPVFIGANTVVGPNAYIRPLSVIGDNCHVGHGFEMYDSIIDDNTTAKHRSYVGHSVIGRDVNLGCGFISSDYRHDGAEHSTLIAGKKVATGRRKLGTFIGDGVRTGIQTSVYPGRKLWPNTATLPGDIVRKDIESL